jgi:hypothetical protein
VRLEDDILEPVGMDYHSLVEENWRIAVQDTWLVVEETLHV